MDLDCGFRARVKHRKKISKNSKKTFEAVSEQTAVGPCSEHMHHGVVRIGSWFGYIAPYYAPRVDGICRCPKSLPNTTLRSRESVFAAYYEYEK